MLALESGVLDLSNPLCPAKSLAVCLLSESADVIRDRTSFGGLPHPEDTHRGASGVWRGHLTDLQTTKTSKKAVTQGTRRERKYLEEM